MAKNAIILKKPHTHIDRTYPVTGEPLELADIKMSVQDAAWLVGIGSAQWVPDQKPAPASKTTDPKTSQET